MDFRFFKREGRFYASLRGSCQYIVVNNLRNKVHLPISWRECVYLSEAIEWVCWLFQIPLGPGRFGQIILSIFLFYQRRISSFRINFIVRKAQISLPGDDKKRWRIVAASCSGPEVKTGQIHVALTAFHNILTSILAAIYHPWQWREAKLAHELALSHHSAKANSNKITLWFFKPPRSLCQWSDH